jgi:hypothetical protein
MDGHQKSYLFDQEFESKRFTDVLLTSILSSVSHFYPKKLGIGIPFEICNANA